MKLKNLVFCLVLNSIRFCNSENFTKYPTNFPTVYMTSYPTIYVTYYPSIATIKPTNLPTMKPSNVPTIKPSNVPTKKPTNMPVKATFQQTFSPSDSTITILKNPESIQPTPNLSQSPTSDNDKENSGLSKFIVILGIAAPTIFITVATKPKIIKTWINIFSCNKFYKNDSDEEEEEEEDIL